MPSPVRWLIPAYIVAPALLLAQQPKPEAKPDTTPHKPARLFRADREPVVAWLEADFKTVFKDRDTNSLKTRRYPAKLRYVEPKGDTVEFKVELATRGNFRLARANTRGCDYSPVKVYFNKEETRGSLFGGEGSLKLGTHCKNGDRYTQNTLMEYAIYGMYNLLTPLSFKARLSTMTWIDPGNPKFTVTQPAIWLQDDEDLAKEFRGKVIKQQGANAVEMEPRQMAITDLFQYMIANTDFSLWALHNFIIVQTDTSMNYYPIAYDFDWAGLVDAPYAFPDYRLSIRRTTDRLYRGTTCHPPELVSKVVDLFKAKKDSIYGVLRGVNGLNAARLKEATSFLDEFFKELNDGGAVKRLFQRPCNQS